ncbi:iron uptake porin [Pseudanabaena sp. 'Roaring Creek']|uniref:iron uptake porin n=1 Tax=Pseudanabaena sp. 'Roaring Creek' TaxID=1681830 RepID=UPI0006D795DB|nr:iron uptake porin [Pseudanabaena sp. 'Roaring Creek']
MLQTRANGSTNLVRLTAIVSTTIVSTTIASTLMASNYAQAEVLKEDKISTAEVSTKESELVRSISRDPMIIPISTSQTPAWQGSPSPNQDAQIIQAINDVALPAPATTNYNQANQNFTAQGVTSVSQLSDVKRTDWAFTALQSLVERYGCIAGYPDRAYRGSKATTRYEFAAGVNACLDKINEIIASGLSDKVSKADLATLQKLQEEFAAELATLRGRVDALDTKTAKLEAQQFSTTTKLYGQAIFGLQSRFANTGSLTPRNGNKNTPDDATNLTFGYNLQLSLVTQFDNRSILLTGLQAGNASTASTLFANNNFLTNTYTRLGYELDTSNSLQLSDLSYRFLVGDRLAVIVGAAGVSPSSVFRGPNRYESAGQGPISAFAQRNPILNFPGQAGIGFDWQISDNMSLQAVYAASLASDPQNGLTGGPFTAGIQFNVAPSDAVDIALYYLNSYTTNASLNTGVGDNLIGPIAGKFSTNAFGSTVSWRISRSIILGGWAGYTTSETRDTGLGGSVNTFNWMAFLNFPDLFAEGNLGGIYVGQPPKITSSTITQGGIPAFNIPSAIGLAGVNSGDFGGQPASTTHVELFYRMRVNDNISITPGLLFIFNPVQTAGSDTITVGSVRTTFTF